MVSVVRLQHVEIGRFWSDVAIVEEDESPGMFVVEIVIGNGVWSTLCLGFDWKDAQFYFESDHFASISKIST